MRWAESQRDSFISERLRTVGRINRSDLHAMFKISAPQAAIDFDRFMKRHPGAMQYDRSKKCYVATHADLLTPTPEPEPEPEPELPDPRQRLLGFLSDAELRAIGARLDAGCPTPGLSLSPWCEQLMRDAAALWDHIRYLMAK